MKTLKILTLITILLASNLSLSLANNSSEGVYEGREAMQEAMDRASKVSKMDDKLSKSFGKLEKKVGTYTSKMIKLKKYDLAIAKYKTLFPKVDKLVSTYTTEKSDSIYSGITLKWCDELYKLFNDEITKLNNAKSNIVEPIRIGETEEEKEKIISEAASKILAGNITIKERLAIKEEMIANGGDNTAYNAVNFETELGDTFETCAVFYPGLYPAALAKYVGASSSPMEASDIEREISGKYGLWKSAALQKSWSRVNQCIGANPKNLSFEEYEKLYKTLYGKELTLPKSPWYEIATDYVDLDGFIQKYIK